MIFYHFQTILAFQCKFVLPGVFTFDFKKLYLDPEFSLTVCGFEVLEVLQFLLLKVSSLFMSICGSLSLKPAGHKV